MKINLYIHVWHTFDTAIEFYFKKILVKKIKEYQYQ